MNGIKTFTDFLILSKDYYEKEPVFAAASKFLDKFYVKIEPYEDSEIKVYYKTKDVDYSNISFADEFSNTLIIEQAKFDLEKRFGNIRDIIVQQAFYPLEKK